MEIFLFTLLVVYDLGITLVEEFISHASEMKSFSGVISWILKTHAESIVSLTSEIAPFLETGFHIDEKNEEVTFPTATPTEFFPANVGNLLLRTVFFPPHLGQSRLTSTDSSNSIFSNIFMIFSFNIIFQSTYQRHSFLYFEVYLGIENPCG